MHWIAAQFCVCMFLDSKKQTFKHVPKFQWIPLTKIPWIPRTNICNVNFVGTFVVPLIQQQANIDICSGFRNCKRIPQSVSGNRKCKWNRQNLYAESANISRFRKLEVDSEFFLLLTLHMNNQKPELDFLSIARRKLKART